MFSLSFTSSFRRVLTVLCVLLCLGGAAAAGTVIWDDGGGDHDWNNPVNWAPDGVPDNTGGSVIAEVGMLPGATVGTDTPTVTVVHIGKGGGPGAVTVENGARFGVQIQMTLGQDADGTLTVNDGIVAAAPDEGPRLQLYVGYGGGHAGTLNMNGGYLSVSGTQGLRIGNNAGSSGHINLHGGTIACSHLIMDPDAISHTMDVAGGTLIVDGDVAAYVQGFIDSGDIYTSYGNGGVLELDYDVTNPGQTTLKAKFTSAEDTYYLQKGSLGPSGQPYTGVQDTHLTSGSRADATPGGGPMLRVGSDVQGRKSRSLIRFNFDDIASRWVWNSQVVSAQLRLYVSEIEGPVIQDKVLNLYRISEANTTWAAGPLADDGSSGIGYACWNWKAFDNSSFPQQGYDDAPRRFPWAGDQGQYSSMWPDISNFVSSGCGVSGVDYVAEPIATATVSSADEGGWVVLNIADPSFLNQWIQFPDENAGFLLRSGGLEAGGARLAIASSEYVSAGFRPMLEMVIPNLSDAGSLISYCMPYDGKVSISIFDRQGAEVRKLASSSERLAGATHELWNGKTDAINWGETVATVPDGRYTVKILTHQGLHAEYMHTLGQTFPVYEGSVGGRSGSIRAFALQDTTAVHIGPKGFWWAEGALARSGFSIAPDGTRLVTYTGQPCGYMYTGAMAYDNGRLYYLCNGLEVYMKEDAGWSSTADITKLFTVPMNFPEDPVTVNGGDIAVRDGVMVLTLEEQRKIQWRDAESGNLNSEVALGAVPRGVSIDNQGRALVIVDDQVLAYTAGDPAAETVIDSGLDGAYRVSINRSNGEIYVAEGGAVYNICGPWHAKGNGSWNGTHPVSETGQQIKRFSAGGQLLQTYGQAGGRPLYGSYNPLNFRMISDLEVAPDGSFWVTEDGSWSSDLGPASLRHLSVEGELIRDFTMGSGYAADGRPDPDDPSIVWVPMDHHTMVRYRVDWVNRTSTALGSYNMRIPPMIWPGFVTNRDWYVVKKDGKTFFYINDVFLYFDEVSDTIYPVARVSGEAYHSQKVNHLDCEPWASDLEAEGTTMNNYTSGFPKQWYDADGDRSWLDSSEWSTPDNVYNELLPANPSWCDYDGNLYGVSVTRPTWHTVNGVPIPSYDYGDTQWISPFMESLYGSGYMPPRKARPFFGLDSTKWCPGREMWLHPRSILNPNWDVWNTKVYTPGWLYVEGTDAVIPDGEGNLFEAHIDKWDEEELASLQSAYPETDQPGYDDWRDIKRVRLQNLIIKRDQNYNPISSVRLPKAAGQNPEPGEIGKIDTWIGSVKGCLFAVDFHPDISYAWDEDGLWIGQLLENPSEEMQNFVWHKPKTYGCGEQFGGHIYEVPTDDVPGLSKGDVLFFVAGGSSCPVLKISGFDQFVKIRIPIVVEDGKIIYHGAPEVNGRQVKDLNGDCGVDSLDLALMAAEWLDDNSLGD